jgi:hypothetical protein
MRELGLDTEQTEFQLSKLKAVVGEQEKS